MDIDLLGRIDNNLEAITATMKDFCDIWLLSRTYDFEGGVLAQAVEKTFEARGTLLTAEPAVFEPSFANDVDRQIQWAAFVGTTRLSEAPESLSDVASDATVLREPVGHYSDERDGHTAKSLREAEALAEAKTWLRDYEDGSGRCPDEHPYCWSAFILIGDRS